MRRVPILLLLVSLMGCDPNVDIENIAPNKLLLVTCFISPQDTIFRAYVFRASMIGTTVKEDSAAVKDALVTISDGVDFDTLYLSFTTHPISGLKSYKYVGNKKNVMVKTSSTYFLNVQTPSGEGIQAVCTIPLEPEIPIITGSQENEDYNFFVNWTNPALYKYFILVLDADGSYPNANGEHELQPSLVEDILFPSDQQVIDNSYEAVLPYAYIAVNPVLKVTVRNIDEGLFYYFKSYQRYEEWDANNSGNFFPNFQSMPLLYSNIIGGVGVFGGYNDNTIEVDL